MTKTPQTEQAKTDKAAARKKWFDDHMIIIGPDKETEQKITTALRDKVSK